MHTKTYRCTEYLTALDKTMEKHHSVIQVKPAYLNCSSCYRLSTTLLDTPMYYDYMHESWFNVHVTHHPRDHLKWNDPFLPCNESTTHHIVAVTLRQCILTLTASQTRPTVIAAAISSEETADAPMSSFLHFTSGASVHRDIKSRM